MSQCDEQRPECGRCLKSGIQCQGWEKHRNFVGAGSISEAKKQQKINNPEPNGGSPCSDMTRTSSAAPPNPEMPIVVHSALTKAPTMRAQVFAAFIQNYFSSGSISSTTYFDDSIFYSIGGLVQRSQVTERALSAMSCIFLGKVNHNPSMFNHGVYLYQTAIQNISNMLRRGIYTHDLFYTVYLCQEIDVWPFDPFRFYGSRLTLIIASFR